MWCSGSYSWPLLKRSRVQIPLRTCVFLILARRGQDRIKNGNDRHRNGRTGMAEHGNGRLLLQP
jgi:hypothetical protein